MVFDLLGQILPDVDGKRTRLQRQYPSFSGSPVSPSGAYQKLTGNYDEEISAEDTYQKLIDTILMKCTAIIRNTPPDRTSSMWIRL